MINVSLTRYTRIYVVLVRLVLTLFLPLQELLALLPSLFLNSKDGLTACRCVCQQ